MKRTTKISRVSKRPKKRVSRIPLAIMASAVFAFGTTFLVVSALLVTAGVAAYRYYNAVVPDGLQALSSYEAQPYEVSLIESRDGNILQDLVNPDLGIRELVPLDRIPADLQVATIDTENKTFYSDPGVDPVRVLEATVHDFTHKGTGLQGASTLTQQLVKLAVFGTDNTPRKLDQSNVQRKLQEIMIAIGATREIAQDRCGKPQYLQSGVALKCRKDAILEMYLNTVPYGDQTYGVEAAAHYYFGKHVWQLDLAQSAFLAGLPQAPSQYAPSPAAPSQNLPAGLARQHDVLDFMLAQNDISQARHDAAWAEPLHFVFRNFVSHNARNTYNSYFVDWLVNVYLSNPDNLAAFNIPDLRTPNDIYRGFIFRTTLDPHWQDLAQSTVTQQVNDLAGSNVQDGALVAIDPRSNEIKAMVGGIGYDHSQYNMAWELRQAGSSFKPFVYVTAFEHGHFPAETINDAFVQYPDQGQPDGYYTPRNYDLSYHGLVTIRKALANSYNVPAVKTLNALGPAGIGEVLKTTNDMGYHLEIQDPHRLGLAFALGANRGRLLEETNAYAVFANGGIYRPYMPILAIYRKSLDGSKPKLVWQYHTPKGVQVLAPQFAYLITSILSDTAAKVPAFGDFAFSLLGLGDRPVASKTGTTNDFKDNLTMGYTPDLVTGVWVGNPDDSEMLGTTGVTGAAPIWHAFMSTVLDGTPIDTFVQPTGIITGTVAQFAPPFSLPGLATNGNGVTDIFAAGTLPSTFDHPGQDDYSGQPTPVAVAKPTAVPNTGGQTQCANGQHLVYVTKVVNGQTVYQATCQ